jgi:hypothetical protein
VYCTRTVPEMEKVLAELAELVDYRARYFPPGGAPKMLALGLSSRKNLCIHPRVAGACTVCWGGGTCDRCGDALAPPARSAYISGTPPR